MNLLLTSVGKCVLLNSHPLSCYVDWLKRSQLLNPAHRVIDESNRKRCQRHQRFTSAIFEKPNSRRICSTITIGSEWRDDQVIIGLGHGEGCRSRSAVEDHWIRSVNTVRKMVAASSIFTPFSCWTNICCSSLESLKWSLMRMRYRILLQLFLW